MIKEEQYLRELTSVLKEVLLWVECYQVALHATEKLFVKESSNGADFTVAVFYEIIAAMLPVSNHQPDQSAVISIKAGPPCPSRKITTC